MDTKQFIARLTSTLGSVSPAGELSSPIDLFNVPLGVGPIAVTAGETWSFQCWHRDFLSGSPTSNFTDVNRDRLPVVVDLFLAEYHHRPKRQLREFPTSPRRKP